MSRKTANDGLDLSLTGSQISTLSSVRSRPGSAKSTGKRPGLSSSQRDKASLSIVNGLSKEASPQATSGKGRQRSSTSHAVPVSGRSAHSDSARSKSGQAKASTRDDFMMLFDGTSPKILKPKQALRPNGTQTKTKTAWGSDVLSARSTRSVNSEDGGSKTTGHGSRFSHSVFQPTSARTSSTVEEDDYENRNYELGSPLAQSRDNMDFLAHASSQDEIPNPANRFSRQSSTNEDLGFRYETRSSPRDELSRSRNSLQGEGLGFSFSHQQVQSSSQKIHNLNSIANNMTSLGMSPGTKTPLVNMENSYQNIKHKTPVNQVRQSPSQHHSIGRNITEDHIKVCNMAATKIQRWYRRHQTRSKAGHAAMKRLLDNKRQEKEHQLLMEQDYLQEGEKKTVEDRKRTREEKARQARQQAIMELQKKREDKRLENKEKAEEEVRFLQASGKITKHPNHKTSNVQCKVGSKGMARGSGAQRRASAGSGSESPGDGGQRDNLSLPRPGTASSTGMKIEDIFQNNSPRHASNGNEHASDGEDETLTGRGQGHSPREITEEQVEGATSQTATKTTLEDLMDTLKKLEEEERLPTARKDKNKTPHNWLDDHQRHHSDEEEEFLTADKLQKLHPNKDNLKKSGFLTDEKLKSIMSFLDEVETAERIDDLDQELTRANETLDKPALLVPTGEELAHLEQASAMASEVTNTVLSQRLQLDEKNRTVHILQKALNQQRELTVRHAKETEKEMKKRLDVQKDEYEETIKRHLSFIDQLIDDKKSLGEKCEQLVKELKTVDKKYQDRIKTMADGHNVEIGKLKDVHAAAEKLRREKWIDEKTKKIKEMTVKGLEPEIQRLIAKHKAEIKKLKSIHEAELLASDERAGQRYIKMTEELRDQLAKEKETACARERELARQTYEKQMQQEEEAYQSQRRRLFSEVQEEKERLQAQATRQRAEIDRLQRQLEDTHASASDAMKREFEKAREEQERRHAAETRQLKDQLAVEKTAWEENYMKKQDTWLMSKERELKETVKKDRDKEIEMVISQLEEDNQATREECERLAENRIKRVRDKYESEMTELERSERLTTEKYNRTKAKLAEVEGENERSKVVIKQKDKEIEELKKLLDKLNTERSQVSEVVRQEFADRIVATEEENKRLKNNMSELKALHKVEVERAKIEIEVVQKSKEEEMEEVHKRVKQAIVKKEEVVHQLRQQYQAALKRADHLEGLLDQQRKQLLSKK